MASQNPQFPDELVHAAIADIMLKTAQQLSSFLELYFETAHPSIIKISLELVKTIKLDCVSDRVKLLESLLSQNRITVSEFPIFCHLCYCQLKFNGLSETKTAKMIALQNSVYQKLQAENVTNLTRFHHLTLLSQQFVNIFHGNL
uniref:Uncharacterized protein n=1 Tax=Panagrolaimus davidi TaxID=227884 RepID=A0A914Q6V2_9BILA